MNHTPKNLLGSISSIRLTIYTVAFIIILLGTTSYFLFKKNNEWNAVVSHMEKVAFLTQKEVTKRNSDKALRSYYNKSKSHYLQEQLEPLCLLQNERDSLIQLIHSPGFCGNKALEERLSFLSSYNKIKLEEFPLYISSNFKEMEVRLSCPVEMSLTDLEIILKKIESPIQTKPLLQPLHFSLKRKNPIEKNEVFEVSFKILKREFLDP